MRGSILQPKQFKFFGSNVDGKAADDDQEDAGETMRMKFLPYKNCIENLTNSIVIKTEFDVVNVEWSNDGERFLVILMAEDEHYQLRQYCASSFDLLKTRNIRGDYVKCNKIIQNKLSSLLLLPYLLDGKFKVLIFDYDQEYFDLNLSEMLGFDEYNRPNDNFPYPHMDGCFLKDGTILMNLYRTQVMRMYIVKINPEKGTLTEQPWFEQFPDT